MRRWKKGLPRNCGYARFVRIEGWLVGLYSGGDCWCIPTNEQESVTFFRAYCRAQKQLPPSEYRLTEEARFFKQEMQKVPGCARGDQYGRRIIQELPVIGYGYRGVPLATMPNVLKKGSWKPRGKKGRMVFRRYDRIHVAKRFRYWDYSTMFQDIRSETAQPQDDKH